MKPNHYTKLLLLNFYTHSHTHKPQTHTYTCADPQENEGEDCREGTAETRQHSSAYVGMRQHTPVYVTRVKKEGSHMFLERVQQGVNYISTKRVRY